MSLHSMCHDVVGCLILVGMLFVFYMLVNDAIGKHLVAPSVLYVIHK